MSPWKRLKKQHGFEISIGILVMMLLLVVTIPQFKQNQLRAKPKQLLADMATVLQALQQYQIEHERLPPCLFNGVAMDDGLKLIDRILWLRETGIVQSELPFIQDYHSKMAYDFCLEILHADSPTEPKAAEIMQEEWERLYDQALDKSDIVSLQLLCFWPLVSDNKSNEFHQFWRKRGDKHYDSRAMFHPSNGLRSAGYVYLNTNGGFSPKIDSFSKPFQDDVSQSNKKVQNIKYILY
jgi:competence protein ComGC